MESTVKKANQLDQLNSTYEPIASMDRLARLFEEFDHDRILISSSFGTTSVILLHMLSKVAPEHPVYFINTHYLFEETVQYRQDLQERLGVNIVDVYPNQNKHDFTAHNQSWKTHTDLCCFVNKVDPMEKIKETRDIWVSGIFRFQNENRAKMRVFENQNDGLKFHPIIDMTAEEVNLYMTIYELPNHPLVYQGYGSLGCTHCTAKGDGREGRWLNSDKTECGLHL